MANAAAVVALLIGGMITAPIAAWLISRINPTLLGGFVGTAIVTLNIPKALGWALAHQQILLLQVAALVLGVALTVWANQRRAQSAQSSEGDAASQQRGGSRVVETTEPTGREGAHAGSSADSEDERVGVD